MKKLPSSIVDVAGLRIKEFVDDFSECFGSLGDRAGEFFWDFVSCCESNTSVERVRDLDDRPGPDVFFEHLEYYSVEDVAFMFDGFFDFQAGVAKHMGLLRGPVDIAIDLNEKRYWGLPYEYTHERSTKTTLVHVYATVCVVQKGFFFTLGCLMVKKDDRIEDIVEKLLRRALKHVDVHRVLLDRGFHKVEVFKKLDTLGLQFITPARNDRDTRITYMTARTMEKYHWIKTIKSKQGEEYKIHMYMKPDPKTTYRAVYTNIQDLEKEKTVLEKLMDYYIEIFEEYRQRWNHENSFKQRDVYQIKTSSKNPTYRLLTYTFADLLTNFWELIHTMKIPTIFTALHMKKTLNTIKTTLQKKTNKHTTIKISRHIKITL